MSSSETPEPRTDGQEGGGRSKRPGTSITELELAFAQDPQSTAYIPLCEAYLEQGRFMEAMVVCKKGLKAHPASVDAKIMLARVYAKQQKYPRAIQELDELIAGNATSGAAHLGRAKVRIDSGDAKAAIPDLKKAFDLDPSLDEAIELLKKQGVIYPEPPPPPPAPVAPPPRAPSYAMPMPPGRAPSAIGAPIVTGVPLPPEAGTPADPVAWPPPMPRSGSGVLPGMALPRPRLEGEEELEALARQVAETKEQRGGSARTSLFLLVGAMITVLVTAAVLFHRKRVTEGISERTRSARARFLDDTYGAYKMAARDYETILEDFDSEHAATLASLAHTYAILWGEHGESDRKPALDRTVIAAEKAAPDNPHTVAARGLALLYDGADRHKAAAGAYDAIWPMAKQLRDQQQGGSWADLTLGILDVELGNYQGATDSLSNVVQTMPASVRAKVWYARAAHRAGHLDRAESGFSEALRIAKDHPGALAGRALVRVQRGRLNEAAGDLLRFDEFVDKMPKEVSQRDAAQAEYARSEVYRAAGDEPRAVGAYEQAVRLDKTNADFPYGLGRSLLAQGRAREALEPLRKAVAMEPNRRAFLIALAQAEIEVGDFAGAEQHSGQALKLDPNDLKAQLTKGRLWRAQRKPETEGYLKQVVETSRGSPEVKLELGRYYREAERAKEAKEVLEKAVNEMDGVPPAIGAQIVLEYGKLNMDAGEDIPAQNSFKMAGEKGAMEGWFRLIQLLTKSGRRDRELLKTACERYLNAGSLPFTTDARTLCNDAR